MTIETLERPLPQIQESLIDPQPAARTDVATTPATSIDLEKVDIAQLAIATLGDWRTKVAKLKEDNEKTVLDLSTQSKVDEAISLRNRTINQPKAAANKTTKAVKSALADASRKLGDENTALQLGYDEAAVPLTKQIEDAQKVIDDKKEAERLAKEARLTSLRTSVDEIMQKWLDRATAEDVTAERIGAGMAMLADVAMPEEVAEVAEHWKAAKSATVAAMTKLQVEKLLAEKQQRDREDSDIDQLNELANDCVARGSQYIKDSIRELEEVLMPKVSAVPRVLAIAAAARQRMAELLAAAERKEAEDARAAQAAWEQLHALMGAARDVAVGRAGAVRTQLVHDAFIETHGEVASWREHAIGMAYVTAMNALQPQPAAQKPEAVEHLSTAGTPAPDAGAAAATVSADGDGGEPRAEPEAAPQFTTMAEPTGEGKAETPGAGDAETAPRDPLARDASGFFLHPDVDWSLVPEEVPPGPYLQALGFDHSLLSMEDDAPALFDQYQEIGEADCSHWTPSRPFGDGWFLGAVYDTEDGPFALWLRRIKAQGITEGQHPQQVVKAEPATADATDRGAAADASPRVGAMGAGQPADAGPAGGAASATLDVDVDDVREAARSLLAVIAVAKNSRFPSQPKVGKEWFDSLYVAAAGLERAL